MEPIPSDPSPSAERSDEAAPGWIPRTPAGGEVEWVMAELAAWAAISGIGSENRGWNPASSKEW
jgi:hypothetical protein